MMSLALKQEKIGLSKSRIKNVHVFNLDDIEFKTLSCLKLLMMMHSYGIENWAQGSMHIMKNYLSIIWWKALLIISMTKYICER